MLSVTVSFLTLGTATKHFLDGVVVLYLSPGDSIVERSTLLPEDAAISRDTIDIGASDEQNGPSMESIENESGILLSCTEYPLVADVVTTLSSPTNNRVPICTSCYCSLGVAKSCVFVSAIALVLVVAEADPQYVFLSFGRVTDCVLFAEGFSRF